MRFLSYLARGLASIALSAAVGASALADEIEIVGTGDGMGVFQALSEAFARSNPEHRIGIPESVGSSGGIKAVGNDRQPLGRVARPLKAREEPYGLEYLPIARVPVVFFVNPDVEIDGLQRQQVLDIYSGKMTNWKEVGGRDARIRVIRREAGDSSLTNLRATLPGFSEISILELSKTTTSTQETVEYVASKSGSIGFAPYSDALDADMRVLSIDGISPSDETYPSYGILALIYKPANRTGVVDAFIRFATSAEGAEAIRSAHALPYR